jgi:hypothetical protein
MLGAAILLLVVAGSTGLHTRMLDFGLPCDSSLSVEQAVLLSQLD